RSGDHDPSSPVPVPAGQEDLTATGGAAIGASFYYAFILQSAPGIVTLAQWDTKPVSAFAGGDVTILDSDSLTPGTNGISVGEDPVGWGGGGGGCKEVVATKGSCALSVLDITSAISSGTTAIIDRLGVTNAGQQQVRARPAAMVMQAAAGTIGVECPLTATGIA